MDFIDKRIIKRKIIKPKQPAEPEERHVVPEYICDQCKNAKLVMDYYYTYRRWINFGEHETTTVQIPCILCMNEQVKDKYYNRIKDKARVNALHQPPVLIGDCHIYCMGLHYENTGKSVLD